MPRGHAGRKKSAIPRFDVGPKLDETIGPDFPVRPTVNPIDFGLKFFVLGAVVWLGVMPSHAAPAPVASSAFIETHCASCHDDVEKKGGLDLTALALKPEDPKNFATWVKVHDRVSAGEMPPKKKKRPPATEM